MKQLFSFPNPVNEKAARVVAGGVLIFVVITLITGWYWLLIPVCYGFWARVLTGPTLSPLGWAAQVCEECADISGGLRASSAAG